MPDWLVALLAVLFFVHLAAFARRAWALGGLYHWLVTGLFVALTASFATRLAAPQWQLGGQPLHLWLRYAAWALGAVTVPLLVARVRARLRARAVDERPE